MTDPVTEYPGELASIDELASGWFSEPPPEDEPDKAETDWLGWVTGFFGLVVPTVGYAIQANNQRATLWQSYRVTVIRDAMALTAEGAIAARTAGIDGYGLTPLQVASVVNARDQILADGGDPTIPIRDMIARLRRDRAAVLAETEVTAAYAGAYLTTWQAAQEAGMVAPGARKQWIARISERTCETCGSLHGQTVALFDDFIGPDGTRYPAPGAHPRCRCGMILEDATVQKISLKAPAGVVSELKRGLKWHEEGHGGDGLKPETVAWARRLADGDDISRDKAVDMSAWLARHESDKSGKGYNPGEEGYPSPGRVAWALWGGDPAVGWSAKMKRHFEGDMKKRDYNAAERKQMAASGEALPDGSFPIANEADLMAAMQSIGRAKNPARAKRHIKRRAKAMGMTDKLTPAFQKAADDAATAKGRPISRYETYDICYDPPDLPIPCTPADLTPTMSAAMPPEMQADFCARWNALTQPLPTGAGVPDDVAYGMALGMTCDMGQWIQQRDGSYVRLVLEGQDPGYEEVDDGEMEKAGRMLSAANHATMHEAASMIEKGCGMMRKMMAESGNPAIVDPESVDMAKAVPFEVQGQFLKVDDEHRLAYGYGVVASVDGKPVKDSQDDVITDLGSMEKAALSYAQSDRAGLLMHKGEAAYSVPFVMPMTDDIAKKLGMTTNKQGIIIAMHFPNTPAGDKGWKMAKEGAGFSVGGSGVRTPMS